MFAVFIAILIALVTGGTSSAQSAPLGPIFFFGGAQSKSSEMNACYPTTNNIAYSVGRSGVTKVLGVINSSRNSTRRYTIVGHSSGAKYANMVANKAKNPDRITLIMLDGYAPRSVSKKVGRRVCWRASNDKRLLSRNYYSAQKSNNCTEVHTYRASHCKTKWCLHFSLVNTRVPAGLDNGNWFFAGYRGCQPNLNWMK